MKPNQQRGRCFRVTCFHVFVMSLVSSCFCLNAARADATKPLAGFEDDFPIAVWLQSPGKAPKYKEIGINLYVGLWKGPTEAQLAELEKHQMPVICDQKAAFMGRKIIVGWMHDDEPDNAQSLGKGKGYGPPITPERIIEDYRKMREKDPARPVLLNLGQGVAYDNYIGRGVRRNKMEDYPRYVQGCDIASFDIYPVNSPYKEVAGNLWYVPRGVARLVEWTGGKKTVWDCIECTPNEKTKPTPAQVRSEVWMSIIHGSRGLIYFAHQFKPTFIEAGLLADAGMCAGVAKINKEVRSLAGAINAPATGAPEVKVTSSSAEVPVATMVRKHGGATYVFAVAMRAGATKATFTVPGLAANAKVEVIGEERSIGSSAGQFEDGFEAYAAHLYKITP